VRPRTRQGRYTAQERLASLRGELQTLQATKTCARPLGLEHALRHALRLEQVRREVERLEAAGRGQQ
jgi:hypothetical protein